MLRSGLSWACAVSILSGCITDGTYVVRGTVSTGEENAARPVAGALVSVGNTQRATANGMARTSTDGSYRAVYTFGGMFPFISGACPVVVFSAPGYRACNIELRGSDAPPGVTRRPCEPPEPGCYVLDVVLSPEPGETVTH